MKKDVLWGYLAQFLQYGAALLVLPLLLRKLSSAELGVWYVFMTISALVTMLDMGFTPTLARNVSYVLGGAKRLFKDGYEVVENPSDVDYGLLKAIIVASKRIFLWISLVAFVLLVVPGTIYIFHVSRGQIEARVVGVAWGLFIIATILNLYYKYFTPLLQGRGLYIGFYKSSAVANLSFVIVTASLLLLDFGFLSVSIGFLISAFVGRWLSWRYFYDRQFQSELDRTKDAAIETKEIIGILWHNAWRLGVGVIGAFLILRANTLLSSAYLGLATTASYALTLQVFSVLLSVSTVVFNIQQPKLAQLHVSNNRIEFVSVARIGMLVALSVFLVFAVAGVLLGPWFMSLIGGATELLPMGLMGWVAVMIFLELFHSISAGIIVIGNKVPFVKPAIMSGIAILIVSWFGLGYLGYGVEWLIASQFVVQLSYNNWQWPWRVYRKLSGAEWC